MEKAEADKLMGTEEKGDTMEEADAMEKAKADKLA